MFVSEEFNCKNGSNTLDTLFTLTGRWNRALGTQSDPITQYHAHPRGAGCLSKAALKVMATRTAMSSYARMSEITTVFGNNVTQTVLLVIHCHSIKTAGCGLTGLCKTCTGQTR